MPSKDIKILMLGCGNALLSENLYDEGYHNIINVDISPVCIQQMTERNATERPRMIFKVMDVTNMSELESNTFDLAIDKSTIDTLLTSENAFMNVMMMLKETQRVLKTGGHYFAISYGSP